MTRENEEYLNYLSDINHRLAPTGERTQVMNSNRLSENQGIIKQIRFIFRPFKLYKAISSLT